MPGMPGRTTGSVARITRITGIARVGRITRIAGVPGVGWVTVRVRIGVGVRIISWIRIGIVRRIYGVRIWTGARHVFRAGRKG
jgi:hypothetical protein